MGEARSKKRKRDAEVPSKPKKKVVLDAPPATVTVSSVLRPASFPPVIVTAPGIELSKKLVFHPYQPREDARSRAKQRRHGGAEQLLLHSTTHHSLDYTATEEVPRGSKPLVNHYLGIYDPKTGKVDLIEAKRMVVRAVVRAKQVSSSSQGQTEAKQSMIERKADLGQTFGTKKAKKAIRDKELNDIAPLKKAGDDRPAQIDSASRALLDSVGAITSTMATREDLQAAIDTAKPVPKANLEAENIQNVYDPAAIIGADILNLVPVRDWQEKARNKESILFQSKFVTSRVVALASNEDEITRLRILRYMGFLVVSFRGAKAGKQKGTGRLPSREELRELLAPAPEAVIENIRRKFSDGGTMRKFHLDLLRTHCCVFACIVDNFEVETQFLREDLQLDQKKMNQYFYEIGARVKQTTDKATGRVSNVARLALPLTLPKQKQIAPRRK